MDTNRNLELRKKIEAMIVTTIQNDLQKGEITGDRAQEIAKKVLELIPEDISDEQLLQALPKLTDHTVELAGVVHQILVEQDEKMKAAVIPKLRAIIAQAK